MVLVNPSDVGVLALLGIAIAMSLVGGVAQFTGDFDVDSPNEAPSQQMQLLAHKQHVASGAGRWRCVFAGRDDNRSDYFYFRNCQSLLLPELSGLLQSLGRCEHQVGFCDFNTICCASAH